MSDSSGGLSTAFLIACAVLVGVSFAGFLALLVFGSRKTTPRDTRPARTARAASSVARSHHHAAHQAAVDAAAQAAHQAHWQVVQQSIQQAGQPPGPPPGS